jgi:hypothetical protein
LLKKITDPSLEAAKQAIKINEAYKTDFSAAANFLSTSVKPLPLDDRAIYLASIGMAKISKIIANVVTTLNMEAEGEEVVVTAMAVTVAVEEVVMAMVEVAGAEGTLPISHL